ncbi:MAG TPA: hypothetical protein VIG30_15810 [Ktedonobacterales bacterium]
MDPACRWTIAGHGNYQYPPAEIAAFRAGHERGALSELPLKANDHLMDATRYALHMHFAQVRAAQQTDGWLARWLGARRTRP